MMSPSPLLFLTKSRLRSRCATSLISVKNYRSSRFCFTLHNDVRRTYSSHSNNARSEALSRGIGGFALGVGLTALIIYALRNNSVKLDGQNVGAVRPESIPKVTTEQRRNTVPDPSQAPHYASPEEIQKAIRELKETLPAGHVITDQKSLQTYGHSDNSYHPTSPHSVVVRPESTDDVVKIVNIARKYVIPIVPYSGATSLEGHFSGVC